MAAKYLKFEATPTGHARFHLFLEGVLAGAKVAAEAAVKSGQPRTFDSRRPEARLIRACNAVSEPSLVEGAKGEKATLEMYLSSRAPVRKLTGKKPATVRLESAEYTLALEYLKSVPWEAFRLDDVEQLIDWVTLATNGE